MVSAQDDPTEFVQRSDVHPKSSECVCVYGSGKVDLDINGLLIVNHSCRRYALKKYILCQRLTSPSHSTELGQKANPTPLQSLSYHRVAKASRYTILAPCRDRPQAEKHRLKPWYPMHVRASTNRAVVWSPCRIL
jgi:hypothetical protein